MTNAATKITPRRERLTLSRAEMADALDLSLSALDRITRDNPPGCVRGGKGNETTFTAHEFIAWYIDREAGRGEGFEAARTRKMNADAERADLEVAKAKGEVALVAEFKRALDKSYREAQIAVMGVPQRVVLSLLGETDESRFKAVLREELRRALTALANGAYTLPDDFDTADLTTIAQEGDDE